MFVYLCLSFCVVLSCLWSLGKRNWRMCSSCCLPYVCARPSFVLPLIFPSPSTHQLINFTILTLDSAVCHWGLRISIPFLSAEDMSQVIHGLSGYAVRVFAFAAAASFHRSTF